MNNELLNIYLEYQEQKRSHLGEPSFLYPSKETLDLDYQEVLQYYSHENSL